MRASVFFFATLALSGFHFVHADHAKETTQYTFGQQPADRLARERLPQSRRSASLSLPSTLKPAVKGFEAKQADIKKRVRFFVHEDGDLNLIDNQGNDYVSTDEEHEDAYNFGTPSALPSPSAGHHSPPPRSASWSATARQRQEHALSEETRKNTESVPHSPTLPREGMDYGARTITSSMMEYKRHIASKIRTTESKIEFLLEMIAEQKQERCEAAKYNLLRGKLIDFRQQSRIWNARIRLLKHELNRQEDELDYYEHEMVMVQRRLQTALRQSQRLSLTSN